MNDKEVDIIFLQIETAKENGLEHKKNIAIHAKGIKYFNTHKNIKFSNIEINDMVFYYLKFHGRCYCNCIEII